MLYDYLLVVFRLIAGLMTNKAIMLCAILGVVIYVIWAGIGVFLSFGYKFFKNTGKLTEFVRANDDSDESLAQVISKAGKISVGLERGIKTYAKNRSNTPSVYVTKGESLDSEVRGGMFNHGKSFMRAFINLTTVLLLVLNLEVFGADKTFTASVFAQATILPIVYYFVIKLFYFLYNLIQQQFYKLDVESFGELVDALDEKFGKRAIAVASSNVTTEENTSAEPQEFSTEENLSQEPTTEEPNNLSEEAVIAEETPAEPPKKTLDDYDFFKRKNIDVEKLKGEVPSTSSVIPYIDVDSDYVIKDDESAATSYHPNATNGSEVLGGMLQNMSMVKKAESRKEPTTDEVKAEDSTPNSEQPKEKNVNPNQLRPEKAPEENTSSSNSQLDSVVAENKSDDFDNLFNELKDYEVDSNGQPENQDNLEVETKLEQGAAERKPQEDTDNPPSLSETPSVEENKVDVSKAIEKIDELASEAQNEKEEPNVEEEIFNIPSENHVSSTELFEQDTTPVMPEPESTGVEENNNIAQIVGKFRPRSKLASGGVVIERNDRTVTETRPKVEKEVNVLSANKDTDSVVSAFKNSTTVGQMGQEAYINPYDTQGGGVDQSYYAPNYPNSYAGGQNTFVGVGYNGYNQSNYMGGYQNGYSNYPNQTEFYGGFNGTPANNFEEEEEEQVQAVQPARRATRTRTSTSRKRVEKPVPKEEDVEEVKRRGRPAKQVFDETVTIKDDKEFEQVLSRAEKLMRKSEEGLSQSQAKRVEKELQSLLEAMNRYKEGK